MQGYKINISDYTFNTVSEVIKDGQFVLDEETKEPKIENRAIKVFVSVTFPLMLCNPQLGSQNGQPPADFDLYEIGVIAKMIEKAKDHVILGQEQYDILVARTKQIQKHLNYKYFEMINRVMSAEKVELTEKKEC